jgi:hypothetical protein
MYEFFFQATENERNMYAKFQHLKFYIILQLI